MSAAAPSSPALPRTVVWLGFRIDSTGQPYVFNDREAFEVQLARLVSVAASSRVQQLVSTEPAAFLEAGFPQKALLRLEFEGDQMVDARPAI